ncbi:MAG: tetratricopeptide repeat protein, partial [Myxococcales bacterium]|nr:tetratricopeptide repeat protein [Myxococcales bacterium]
SVPPPRASMDSLPEIGSTPPPQGAAPRGNMPSDPFGEDPFGAPPADSDPFGAPPPRDSFGAPPPRDSFGAPPPRDSFGAPPPDSFGPPPGDVGSDFDDFGGPSSGPTSDNAIVRQAGGGVSYGEVNLGDEGVGGGSVGLEGGGEDDMEFGAIPQEDQPKPKPAQAAGTHVQLHVGQAGEPQPQKRGKGRIVLGVAVIGLLAGGALALVPSVGPFGAYWILDQVKSGEYQQLVQTTVKNTRAEMAKDTFASATAAFESVDRTRASEERVKPLAAYTAFTGFLSSLRFGVDSKVTARAKVLLQELKEASDVDQLELARAAEAASDGNLARARQVLSRISQRDPQNIDALAALGEVELLAKDPKAATEVWTRAGGVEQSPRTDFGLARAKLLAGDTRGAEQQAEKVLKANPEHVGARILLARAAWSEHEEDKALELLSFLDKPQNPASPSEVVEGETLRGDIHLSRSRITHAEKAYQKALTISPKAAGALAGLGDALYRSGRFSEALARFKAGVEADPDNILASIGIAKTQIALERLEDAKAVLKKLATAHPDDARVGLWLAKAEDALGNRQEAEAAYKKAISTGKDEVAVVEAYIGLAMLMSQQGRNEEAEEQLAAAQKKMPRSPAIFKALGEVALAQGRYEEAVKHFQKALSLDKKDIGAQFRLGVAYRRNRDFDAARKEFDAVSEVDREYPGLALERGLLYEAAGQSEEALKEYEAALAKAPNDPDLKLRVGCGKVSAGRGAQAEKILKEVLQVRPTSAETNHCLGRALLLKGNSLAEALKALERARDLDPNRAEYHLYVGWAANEAGNPRKAEEALAKALELDKGLADAYWQRGVLRYRQGAVKDAITDLQQALELRPTRYEAHADLAEAYDALGQERAAMDELNKAIAADPDNALWRYRYGKLLAANRQDNEAREQLGKSIEIAEKEEPKPRWLWEAHRLYAKALGPRKEAVKHWEAFLRDGPRDSAYRGEAKEALKKLGRPWEGP